MKHDNFFVGLINTPYNLWSTNYLSQFYCPGLSAAVLLQTATEAGDKALSSRPARFSLSNIYRSWNVRWPSSYSSRHERAKQAGKQQSHFRDQALDFHLLCTIDHWQENVLNPPSENFDALLKQQVNMSPWWQWGGWERRWPSSRMNTGYFSKLFTMLPLDTQPVQPMLSPQSNHIKKTHFNQREDRV